MSEQPIPRQRVGAVSGARLARVARWCGGIVESRGSKVAIVVIIHLNALVLGVETYPHPGSLGTLLRVLEWCFRAVFVIEIALRVLAHGRRPQDFFKRGWNVFDFAVIAVAFIPGLRGESAALRVIRMVRVARLMRFSPGLRTIVVALLRSLPGVGGTLALTGVTLYLYGMAGWLIFKDTYPDDYGTIGQSVLTLFVLVSLNTLPELVEQGMALSPWTLVFYVSYVIITVNLLLNILIAVIVNSMEEARRLEMTEQMAVDEDRDGVPDHLDRIMVSQRLDDMRTMLTKLEQDLRIDRRPPQ